MDERLLGIYLNDHLAGAVAGIELAERCRSSNRSNEIGRYLERLLVEVREDRGTLESVIRRLDLRRDSLKVAAGWAAEKATRLKLNGRVLSYSPLSRIVELEGLSIGVEGKRLLWRVLARVAETEPRLEGFDFRALIRRAERQRANLERLRAKAVAGAFALPAPSGAEAPSEQRTR